MRVIHRYSFEYGEPIQMPIGATVIKVGLHIRASPQIWVIVPNHDAELEVRKFHMFGTGQPIPESLAYVGTFFDAEYVWHLFEEPND